MAGIEESHPAQVVTFDSREKLTGSILQLTDTVNRKEKLLQAQYSKVRRLKDTIEKLRSVNSSLVSQLKTMEEQLNDLKTSSEKCQMCFFCSNLA